MRRVTAPGVRIGAYVWDCAEKMELIRHFWDAAIALDPGAAAQDEARRFPLCRPEALRDLFAGAGLAGVEVAALDVETPFVGFDDYWEPFLGGQGPAPGYVMSLDEARRHRLRERLRERLTPGGGPFTLIARAWAVRGQVPALTRDRA
jgi:hypothetical protein